MLVLQCILMKLITHNIITSLNKIITKVEEIIEIIITIIIIIYFTNYN